MITLQDIRVAKKRLSPYLSPTPILHSDVVDDLVGAHVSFKAESLQLTGSFKIRGALNALLSLSDDSKTRGVIAYSSGNHGKALAYAGKLLGVRVTLVLSNTISEQKLTSIRSLGAEVQIYDPVHENRVEVTDRISKTRGLAIIPPYELAEVITGQGTCALEIFEQLKYMPDAIFIPIGGGGLIAGMSIASKETNPDVEIVGVEPDTANDQQISFKRKKRVRIEDKDMNTICEGLRTNEPGELAFPYILRNVDSMITASDKSVRRAMRLIWDELKLVVEPAGALTLASLLENRDLAKSYKSIVLVVCGGNISMDDYLVALDG